MPIRACKHARLTGRDTIEPSADQLEQRTDVELFLALAQLDPEVAQRCFQRGVHVARHLSHELVHGLEHKLDKAAHGLGVACLACKRARVVLEVYIPPEAACERLRVKVGI